MADVTGSIGNQPVQLNNAATEATLQRLIDTITGQSGPAAAAKAAQIASTAGINNANIQLQNLATTTSKAQQAGEKLGRGLGYAHTAADSLAESFIKADKALGPFVGKLISGTAAVSDFYGALSQLPGVLGTVASVFQKVAEFQETNLDTYQKLTNAGANFGGSLTQIRQAALSTYMSLSEFTNLIKNNGEAFSKMGGTVNQGAMAFTKLSNSLLKSEAGDELRALGYTTEQVNQGMLNYINMTGGRTKEELKNTKDITAASVEYLTQLDGLAQITGKSREQQEQALKEANQNAAVQAKLAGMDEKQKAAYNRGLAEMEAKFGKAGREMYQAQVLGIPPMTEAAKNLTALAPEVSRASQGMADVANRGGTAAETLRYSAQATEGAVKASEKFTNVAGAMSFQGGALGESIMNLTNAATKARQQGRTTEAAELEARAKILEEEKKRKESEAADAVKAQKAVQEMGQSIMAMLLPAIKLLTPVVNAIVGMFSSLLNILAEYKTITIGLVAALGVYLATQKVQAAMTAVKSAQRAGAGARGVIGAAASAVFGGGGLGALGSSAKNPLFVTIVGSILPGLSGSLTGQPGAPGSQLPPAGGQPGGPGAPGQRPVPANREERLRRVQEGRQAQQAARAGTALKIGGIVGALASAGTLLSEFSAIDKKAEDRAKEVGKEQAEAEAKKEKFSVGGETAGGIAGGFAGAKLGALLGTAILPGIGTAVGGAIGGLAGGLLGAMGGSKAGEAMAGSKDLPKMAKGGIVNEPTEVLAGEEGPEAIIPLKQFESLRVELEMLNKQSAEMIRYMKETADYAKRNVDATKSLNGDLFKF